MTERTTLVERKTLVERATLVERKSYTLQLAPKVYEALQSWAKSEGSTVDAKIESLLAGALQAAGRAPR